MLLCHLVKLHFFLTVHIVVRLHFGFLESLHDWLSSLLGHRPFGFTFLGHNFMLFILHWLGFVSDLPLALSAIQAGGVTKLLAGRVIVINTLEGQLVSVYPFH